MRALVSVIAAATLVVAPAGSQIGAQVPAQPVVEGRVLDAETGAPIAGATVLASRAVSAGETAAAETRTATDAGGSFSLPVPAGRVTVQVVATGYFPLTTTLDVGEAGLADTELSLSRDTAFATSVDVVAALPATAPATEVVQPEQVLRTPGALDNIYRTLQTLPGVTATEEFGSRLAVRGGSPDQNLTVMDGVEIHDPYRLFGLTSAFNPETIQRFELATGGFSVEYGDRLSSLLVVENRDGQSDARLAGSMSLSITDANIVLEGGLPGNVVGSWLVTGRRTYYDLIAERFTDQQFPAFADLQAKGVWEPGAGRRVTLFGLRSRHLLIRLFQQATTGSVRAWRARRFRRISASFNANSPPKRLVRTTWRRVAGRTVLRVPGAGMRAAIDWSSSGAGNVRRVGIRYR